MNRRTSTVAYVMAGLAVALLLALFVAPHASSSPDGLAKIAADKGLDSGATAHTTTGGALAGYSVRGIHNGDLSTGVAGIVGVAVVFCAALGLSKVIRASRSQARPEKAA